MPDMKKNELCQMNLLDEIFVSKKAFRISNLIAIICFLLGICILFCSYEEVNVFGIVAAIVLIAMLIGMEYCSRNYKDNAVKSIIGVLLGVIFAYDLRFFDRYYSDFSTIGVALGAAKIALGFALIVLYILARDSKKSNHKLIIYVRMAFVTLALFTILNNIPYYVADWTNANPYWILQDVARTLAFICTYFSIVCAAGTVDRYKMIREHYTNLGEWTEELREETKKELFGK